MSTSKILLVCAIGSTLLVGCAKKPRGNGNEPAFLPSSTPKPAPQVPPRVDTPVDQELRRSAAAELTRAFASADPVVRANTTEATQRGLGPMGADRIRLALDDKAPLVRFSGAMAAGTLKLAEVRPKLLSLVNDPSPTVQVGVRYALHMLGEFRYSHDLEAFAQHTDPRVRANTVLALGLLGDQSAIKILRVLERDPNPAVRLQALEALYRLGDESALEKLVTGTISKYVDDQIICLLALSGRKDGRVARVLEGKLTDDYPEVSLAAARSLAVVGSDAGMGVGLKFATSREARQRGMAAMVLGEIGRPDAQPHLERLLRDNDQAVRLAAAAAILRLRQA
ncbi:MAG: HEAT repeat domain-containing protein [Burkholderiales bacterium]|nr:HEAT repeat domain-containing protein [Phycisphaerae bacterium]